MAQTICSSVKHLFLYWDSNKKKMVDQIML